MLPGNLNTIDESVGLRMSV